MRITLLLILILLCWRAVGLAEEPSAASPESPWDFKRLSRTPETFDPPEVFSKGFLDHLARRGIRGVWYEGEPCRGKPTRNFAWLGIPDHEPGEKLPGMVLVHGGGGTANWQWVRHWMKHGYAAIAMDTCGYLPVKGPKHIRNKKGRVLNRRTEYSGPKPYGFDGLDRPAREQWPYHAVSAVVLGHSLLRSLPEVDAERTGLIGVSWGGYLTCLTVGVDNRFACAISVYGCGFLQERSVWMERELKEMSDSHRQRWAELWDPSSTLGRARMPMLWVTGTNDFAYWMPSLVKSARLPEGPVTLAVRVRMRHGHAGGWEPKENYVFADSYLRAGTPLARIRQARSRDGRLEVSFGAAVPVVRAELVYTTDAKRWPDRHWQTAPAELDAEAGRARAEIPPGATGWFMNLFDERSCVVSSLMHTLEADAQVAD